MGRIQCQLGLSERGDMFFSLVISRVVEPPRGLYEVTLAISVTAHSPSESLPGRTGATSTE